MCCFLVPMVQAIATTAYRKHGSNAGKYHVADLEKMLWGGTVMLVVDHIINGELNWSFPFFTALGKTGGTEVFFSELLTVGVPMSIAITAVWGIYEMLKSRRAVPAKQ